MGDTISSKTPEGKISCPMALPRLYYPLGKLGATLLTLFIPDSPTTNGIITGNIGMGHSIVAALLAAAHCISKS